METPIVPPEVLKRIGTSGQLVGTLDHEGVKYFHCPNINNKGGFNPTHIFDQGLKIGKMEAEGKLQFFGKAYISEGAYSRKGGATSIFIFVYKVAERWKQEG